MTAQPSPMLDRVASTTGCPVHAASLGQPCWTDPTTGICGLRVARYKAGAASQTLEAAYIRQVRSRR